MVGPSKSEVSREPIPTSYVVSYVVEVEVSVGARSEARSTRSGPVLQSRGDVQSKMRLPFSDPRHKPEQRYDEGPID